jgi:hypothetical protein
MGFSFPCASPANPDASLKAFLKADPQSVYNPFPLVAQRVNFRQHRTHPLVILHYWPLTDQENNLEVNETVKFFHEREHIDNNGTPAKRWAQYLEGAALQRVYMLVNAEKWDREAAKSWKALRNICDQLSVICERICFSEELLATAKSFEKIDRLVSTNSNLAEWQGKLRIEEDESLAYYEREELRSLFPDFRNLYKRTIKCHGTGKSGQLWTG